MATFEELITLYTNPGETGIPETFADDLRNAYTEDLSVRDAAVQAREQAIAERDAQIAAADKENLRLKAVNYDLLMAAPKAGEPDKDITPDVDSEQQGVNSLFE